ncbi:phosphatase [Halococcus sp. IIIV-5B]|uniref:mechanosensitive ion channel family protein n=1 Tax=Halococcus sp. IIIV-5B TaxID=2321230 RepID=UPI000E74ED82|nr:phosphatase [Halococcus sp. IIIV-5B]RJS97749.1 phosphatase [Halococcus sp. IIIV-5B]
MRYTYTVNDGIVLQQVPQYLQDTVANIIGALPAIVAAIVILVIGLVVGRVLGGVVERVVRRVNPGQYVQGTPLARRDVDGDIAQALGDLVKYIVYFLALLLALDQVNLPIPGDVLSDITTAGLRVVVAAAILVAGFAVGRFVGSVVTGIVDGFGFDSYLRGTPLATVTSSIGGVGRAVGVVVELLVYYFAVVAAVDALEFPALARPLSAFVGQLPFIVAGLLVLVVGIYLADVIGDFVAGIDRSRATDIVGLVVQLFVYYVVIVFALDTAGFDTTVLLTLFNTVVIAFFGALGIALALAVGIGVGWGSKDYVAENIDDWVRRARGSAADLAEEDSGSDEGFDSPPSD